MLSGDDKFSLSQAQPLLRPQEGPQSPGTLTEPRLTLPTPSDMSYDLSCDLMECWSGVALCDKVDDFTCHIIFSFPPSEIQGQNQQ